VKGVKRKWRAVLAPPLPSGAPLREVVAQIAAKSRQLSALDDEIGRALGAIERLIRTRRPAGHPVDVPFPPWGKLGWSGRRGRRWRLVVVDDEACDLCDMPRECRAQACFVLGKLFERLDLRR
jgi:hypothetical protein